MAKEEIIDLAPLSEVIADFKAGKMVIIVDDPGRENEGDLAVATEMVTAEHISFMTRYGRGLICTSISAERARALDLPLQVLTNNSAFNTPFAISIDHHSVSESGITASSRAKTMRALLTEEASPSDFKTPGSVFPLIAHPAGVIGRNGQTEGSYDLARLAELKPSGVICEILNEDGTMARGAELNRFAKKHEIKITSVAEIAAYRIFKEVLVREVASAFRDTRWGRFRVMIFQDDVLDKEHIALVYGDPNISNADQPPLVRVHSECLTGDVFGSRRCDCGKQLDAAMKQIVSEGAGVLLYLRQEGRGIGLTNKLKAYALQDKGFDTVEANVELGFEPDERDYAVAAKILNFCGVNSLRLITNNPDKIETLTRFGLQIKERVPVSIEADDYSRDYLACKKTKMGHLL